MASLLSIPVELREFIYEHLFRSYTVKHGFGISSSSNRTAILQTCRQIHCEAWRHLPLNISFHFRGTEAMLDTLLSVDQSVVTRLRHIRVKAFPFPLYETERAEYYTTYYFHNALSLLPGLHLDHLIVEDSFHGFGLVDGWRDVVTYFDIESLLKSDAWKELVYITPNTDFIASGYDHRRKRVAQPENWDALLKERDGKESGAEVQMWIMPQSNSSDGSAQQRAEPQQWSARPGHEVVENWRLATPEQDLIGEVQIIARRGKRARYVQLGLSEKKTWAELKGKPRAFTREDWTPYYNDMADAVGWVYGGWGRRMQLAHMALDHA
ncbi:hypothetical protein BU26DRAFT_436250 [Trematosphaeria pertusa]|uniref:F-box domain-containing protein n=1 Tax=Trematosphaeria pertusa TaxID=390896 RepID=A0A6A6I047_9PLEO|nr:uncharacterized protein BU26DRAFT_436250 [Trematosphaeria pertusa]KAF2243691.1 hypothetical protein BU26DRAFT_436250 [Trematosphaeria pertusa]